MRCRRRSGSPWAGRRPRRSRCPPGRRSQGTGSGSPRQASSAVGVPTSTSRLRRGTATRPPGGRCPRRTPRAEGLDLDYGPGINAAHPREGSRRRRARGQAPDATLRLPRPEPAGEVLRQRQRAARLLAQARLLQRFDREKRVWRDVRKVHLTETGAPPGVGWVWSGTDKVRVEVPKGTTMRAVLPLSQTRPCYLAGYSNLLRDEAPSPHSGSSRPPSQASPQPPSSPTASRFSPARASSAPASTASAWSGRSRAAPRASTSA